MKKNNKKIKKNKWRLIKSVNNGTVFHSEIGKDNKKKKNVKKKDKKEIDLVLVHVPIVLKEGIKNLNLHQTVEHFNKLVMTEEIKKNYKFRINI